MLPSNDQLESCFEGYGEFKEIPSGASGSVFRAVSPRHEDVVVKIISGTWALRGRREIEVLAEMSHPNIVKLLEHGEISHEGESLPFIITHYVDGEPLIEKVNDISYSAQDAAVLLLTISDALDFLWGRRIVHRDIKPANIIVRPDKSGVLLDLGVAHCIDMTRMTFEGNPGTLGYYSPEQCQYGRRLTVKSDVYSLGIALHEAISGSHPFGKDQQRMCEATKAPILAPEVKCPPKIREVLSVMTDPSPLSRPMPKEIISFLQSEV